MAISFIPLTMKSLTDITVTNNLNNTGNGARRKIHLALFGRLMAEPFQVLREFGVQTH